MKYGIYEKNYNVYFNLEIHEIFDKILHDETGIYYKLLDNQWILIDREMLKVRYICHRVNDETELLKINKMFGVEIDLRDDYVNKNVMVVHDPFMFGPSLDDYLKNYNHNFIILNIKSERIELYILELLKKYNITDYFFLDSSFPMIYELNKYNANIALRYSEYELINNNMGNYIWVDCFHGYSLSNNDYHFLKNNNKKICFVSPELQKHDISMINQFKINIKNNLTIPDFICCKHDNIIRWL